MKKITDRKKMEQVMKKKIQIQVHRGLRHTNSATTIRRHHWPRRANKGGRGDTSRGIYIPTSHPLKYHRIFFLLKNDRQYTKR